MKKLLALAFVAFMASFMYASAQNNCTATATGTFTFAVEAPIGLNALTPTTIPLGGICPGCTKTFTTNVNGTNCIAWDVTGGPDCIFHATFTNPSTTPATGVTLASLWQYHDDGATAWEGIPSTDHPNANWYINGAMSGGAQQGTNVGFRLCVASIGAACTAPATTTGTASGTLTVNYICSITQ